MRNLLFCIVEFESKFGDLYNALMNSRAPALTFKKERKKDQGKVVASVG
jgi:hypothetical protein